jgi:hypothetical protein
MGHMATCIRCTSIVNGGPPIIKNVILRWLPPRRLVSMLFWCQVAEVQDYSELAHCRVTLSVDTVLLQDQNHPQRQKDKCTHGSHGNARSFHKHL